MIYTFSDFSDFEKRVRASGVSEDLRSLLVLDLNFFENYGSYAVLNLRDYSSEPNNLMVLSDSDCFYLGGKEINGEQLKFFKYTLKKKYGESTVLALLVMKNVLTSYTGEFEKINAEIDRQEEVLNAQEIERLGRRLRKVGDKVEDFLDLLIKLEDRDVREVNTGYVSYDYDVLLAKARHLLDRIKSHSSQIVGLRNEVESRFSRELNARIEYLSDVVRKLTAITVILMIPNIITGYYGMNLRNLSSIVDVTTPSAELAVIGITIAAMLVAFAVFKWKDWL